VVGRFESLVGHGLERVLGANLDLRTLATDLEDTELERFVVSNAPQVAIVGQAVRYALLLHLKACEPATGVVVLAPDPGRLCGEMLNAAGAACVSPNAPEDDILGAVRLAARGEPTYLPGGSDQVAQIETARSPLTDRETEVLELLSEGRTNPEIADALHISTGTVRTYVPKIFRKIDVHSRQQLIGMRVPQSKK
jgi:DNA-binding NarL/FixJ family response regulator